MLVLTGGKVRTVQEYRDLLNSADFRLNRVIPVPATSISLRQFQAEWNRLTGCSILRNLRTQLSISKRCKYGPVPDSSSTDQR